MVKKERYEFSKEARTAYEMLLLPLGVYQLVDNKVVTLLVSDGLCTFHGLTREELTNGFDNDMFADVHPDDVEMLAKLGLRYATKEGPYDIVYRSRLYGKEEYRYVHAVSKFHGMEDGSRIAITEYTDITDSLETMSRLKDDINSPAVHFLDESMGPMVIVTRKDHRILYYNKAVTQMLKPAVNYDSGLTFDQYFYSNCDHGIVGLFDEADGGLQTVAEPRTGRNLEVNVISCRWGEESAYAVFFYEASEEKGTLETEQRHKRIAFNNAIYSASYNGLEYYEKGYRGLWLWNLTQDRLISQSGHSDMMNALNENSSFNSFLSMIRPEIDQKTLTTVLKHLSRENLMEGFKHGTVPKSIVFKINTKHGQVILHADIIMMESPMDGSVFLKIVEENVTDRLEMNDIISMIVKQQYDFIAYIDVPADHCRIIDGKTNNDIQKDISASLKSYAAVLAERIGMKNTEAAELIHEIAEAGSRESSSGWTYVEKDGSIKNISIHVLSQKNQQYFISCSDVTLLLKQEKDKEQELKQAKINADEANEAKSVFLSSISHDLRTPLNGIISFTDFALKEDDPLQIKDYLAKIDSSGKILLNLINDTLELSRIESGKAKLENEVTLPDQMVADVVTTLRSTADVNQVRIIEEYKHPSRNLYICDKMKLQRIALNLISNAIKYSLQGGTVKVCTDIQNNGEGKNTYILNVSDDGIGMSKEFMARMFEPFSQEKRSATIHRSGTGLGLSIVKNYVDIMNGTIHVESQMHHGSTFIIQIPLEDAQTAPEEKNKLNNAESEDILSGRRVLLCEDNYLNVEIAVTLLKDRRILVETASNGRLGVEKFTASKPGYYDAILMDIQMPEMDGLEASQTIRRLSRPDAKQIPIIALSADAFAENRKEASQAGMNGFVTKPISPRKMFATLEACLRK